MSKDLTSEEVGFVTRRSLYAAHIAAALLLKEAPCHPLFMSGRQMHQWRKAVWKLVDALDEFPEDLPAKGMDDSVMGLDPVGSSRAEEDVDLDARYTTTDGEPSGIDLGEAGKPPPGA
jgi:hypothetical protein